MIKSVQKTFLLIATSTLMVSPALAAGLNSMCYMNSFSKNQIVEGDSKKDKKFPLASISKIVTALWSLETLGPEFRYATKIHITPTDDGLYDIHLEGSQDPSFGRNTGYFVITELARMGVDTSKINTLSFDENFYLSWDLEDKHRISGSTTPWNRDTQAELVKKSLEANFATAPMTAKYNELRSTAKIIGIEMPKAPPIIKVTRVLPMPKASFQKEMETQTLVYKSAPLRTLLKNMNNRSNNYLADHIYWQLGGNKAFKKYSTDTLKFDDSDIYFNLGSGNNGSYLRDDGKNDYNMATCEAMVKILYRADKLLKASKLDLTDIMAVATIDDNSTVRGYGGTLEGAVIAKTGTVNTAKTLAGAVSTQDGYFYFAILMNMKTMKESGSASSRIKHLLLNFIADHGGRAKIKYKKIVALTFDSGSKLKMESSLEVGPRG